MKHKKIITMGLFSVLVLNMGCSQKSTKLEEEMKKSAQELRVKESMSKYRQRLHLLGRFKQKVPMPNIDNNGLVDGKCSDEDKNTDRKQCFDKNITLTIKHNSCEDLNGSIKQKTKITSIEGNNTIITTYTCINKSQDTEKKIIPKHIIYEDIRYISVANIVNKSGKKDLPENLDIIVKNTINTISNNYKLIDIGNEPKANEYRIEGAITGFDNRYSRTNSINGNAYRTQGKEYNLESEHEQGNTLVELSMDFIIKKYNAKYKRWEYIPNVSTSKKIFLLKTDKGFSFTFGLLGGGLSLGNSINESMGISMVTRALIENSMVELLARLDDLPYWSFLPITTKYTEEEKNWKNQLIKHYTRDIKQRKQYHERLVENLLNIFYPNRTNDSLSSKIISYKKKFGFAFIDDKIDAKLVVHLLETIPKQLIDGQSTDTDTMNFKI